MSSLDRDRLIRWLSEGLITHDEFEALLRAENADNPPVQPDRETPAQLPAPTGLPATAAKARARYDLSGFDAYERSLTNGWLEELAVEYQLTDSVLSVSSHDEATVDRIIDEVERHSAELKAAADHSARVARGELPPNCELCGRSPAAPITLRRQVGMVVVSSSYTVQAVLCEACAREAHKDYQKQTAIKGWTGVKSALINPVVIATNANNKRKHQRTIESGNTAPKGTQAKVKPPLTASEKAFLDRIMSGKQPGAASPRPPSKARRKRTASEQAFLDGIMDR